MSNDFVKRGGCTEVDLAASNDSDCVSSLCTTRVTYGPR